tara:strand:- start:1132 stop:1455 length:324 start_codon:yes stop_codon:yes gene_type:complete
MGFIVADRSLLALVRVRYVDLADDNGTDVGEFMETLNQFMADVTEGNDVQISSYTGTIWAEETRLETDAEHEARMAVSREHQRAVQVKADSSWKRQQKKFARARNKK